jgi:hypothetical protein
MGAQCHERTVRSTRAREGRGWLRGYMETLSDSSNCPYGSEPFPLKHPAKKALKCPQRMAAVTGAAGVQATPQDRGGIVSGRALPGERTQMQVSFLNTRTLRGRGRGEPARGRKGEVLLQAPIPL